MIVKLTTAIGGARRGAPGDELDLPEAEAKALIARGSAEPVGKPAATPKPAGKKGGKRKSS